ncbi:RNA chaperone Hfq, partial [Acidaminococcus timonensis]
WGFDNFTVILESEGKQQLIYKHAISTIAPVENEAILVLKKGNDQGVSHE